MGVPLRALLLTILITSFLGNQTWAAGPELVLPERAGEMPLEGIKDYEKESPGGGTGWSYRVKTAKADIYFYSNGMTDIPADVNSPIIARHLQEVIGGVYEAQKLGYYSGVKTVTADQKVFIGSQPFLQAELKFTQDNIPRVSHIYWCVRGQVFENTLHLLPDRSVGGEKVSGGVSAIHGQGLGRGEEACRGVGPLAEPALVHLFLIPADEVADLVEQSDPDFLAEYLDILLGEVPNIGEPEPDARRQSRVAGIEEAERIRIESEGDVGLIR